MYLENAFGHHAVMLAILLQFMQKKEENVTHCTKATSFGLNATIESIFFENQHTT